MMTQYRFIISCPTEKMISSRYAYAIYAWLLEQVSAEMGNALHQSESSCIAQAIWYDRAREQNIWKISLLSKETAELFAPILERLNHITLRVISLDLELCEKRQITSFAQFLRTVRMEQTEESRVELCFLTPTAFKQRGKYTVLPSVALLLNSLVHKWNDCFPEAQIDDADAVSAMEENLLIVDYKLKTTRFPLKGIRVPGFFGELVIESKLPQPLENLWQLLVSFSEYTGVGIKTTLGMGSVEKM